MTALYPSPLSPLSYSPDILLTKTSGDSSSLLTSGLCPPRIIHIPQPKNNYNTSASPKLLPSAIMSSSESAAPSGTNGTAVAPKHDETHQPIVEEVPDEDELRHGPTPVSSSILEPVNDDASLPGWVAQMSSKAAGKQKEVSKSSKPALDTQSEEFFPSLGGAPKAQSSAPKWNVSKPNGASNGASTPDSGTATPVVSKARVPQSLAGQGAPLYTLQPREVLTRKELKRPIPEVLKDINKKTRANLSMTTGEGGVLKFSATGPVSDNVKHQAFRDLGAQICVKVCATCLS